MKRITRLHVSIIAIMVIMFSSAALQAETAKKFNLSVGGYFGIGGATDCYDYDNDNDGAFALGIQPEIQFFPIDSLAVNFRMLWERFFYDYDYGYYSYYNRGMSIPVDVFPFIFGVRYYFPIIDKLKLFAGGGIGFTIMQAHYPGWWSGSSDPDPEGRFAMDFNGGVEFEVIDQLALTGMFDIMLPNLGPLDSGEKVVGRFMFFFGVSYYFQL